jgi:hypothetical protein
MTQLDASGAGPFDLPPKRGRVLLLGGTERLRGCLMI